MIRIAVAEDDLSWAHQPQTYVDQYARESGKSLRCLCLPMERICWSSIMDSLIWFF